MEDTCLGYSSNRKEENYTDVNIVPFPFEEEGTEDCDREKQVLEEYDKMEGLPICSMQKTCQQLFYLHKKCTLPIFWRTFDFS